MKLEMRGECGVKKIMIFMVTVFLCTGILAGCSAGEKNDPVEVEALQEAYLGEGVEDLNFFPVTDAGYVGDPMPFYDEGKFHIFYLLDERAGHTGYHPWALCETENFCEYEDLGAVIPFAEKAEEQDIALGTGSVVRAKDGTYHAFYTGHNDARSPKEAIMHAESPDMKSWTKLPEDTFYAGKDFSQDDFRDPYVRYMEEDDCYWMLVTTRKGNGGVIVRYSSKDLKTWKEEGIFFENDMDTDSNMECPSLVSFGGKWYLAFSDQWPFRQVHYRMADSPEGPFSKPENEVLDGNGFYAGRLEGDGEKLYAFGWNGTKQGHQDSADYDWAGNLVVHEISQKKNGELVPVVNALVQKGAAREISFTSLQKTDSVEQIKNGWRFSGAEYEMVEFQKLRGNYLLQGTFQNIKKNDRFGLAFHMSEEGKGDLNLVFNAEKGKLYFYNTEDWENAQPQSRADVDFGNGELEFSVMIGGGVVCVYVDNQCALTARMYTSQGAKWGFFSRRSEVSVQDVKLFR